MILLNLETMKATKETTLPLNEHPSDKITTVEFTFKLVAAEVNL